MEHLSLSGKRWKVADNVCTTIEALIEQRLMKLEDTGERWNDPSVFPESQKAAERVKQAIKDKEKIAIFGDYDCDGITSTAQMVRYFRRHHTEPIVRLPHRIHDGYGLKVQHVQEFIDAGVTLLITVDTGIGAHEAIAKANEHSIDVIVLDHHHVTKRPDAFAILHPTLAENFPGAHPSAAGVVFLFLCALEGKTWMDRDTDIALAMFGTVADLVPLSGINRRLVQEGLEALTKLPPGPVADLVDQISRGKPLTAVDVAFRIAPRINAAGRMDDPMIGLRAVLEGGEHLTMLETLNTSRQDEMRECTEHAVSLIESNELTAFLSVADSSYQPGIIGLIAGKLTEKFGRPSMAVAIRGDTCTASLRSTPSYNIAEGLGRVAHLLTNYGGHAQAAGCTFPLDNFLELTDALNTDVATRVSAEELSPTLMIDAVLDADELTTEAIEALTTLEPFGQGNPEPTFLIRNAQLERVRCVGSDESHLQAMVGSAKLIGFRRGEWLEHSKESVDLVCRLGIDRWKEKESVQLILTDMRTAKTVAITV